MTATVVPIKPDRGAAWAASIPEQLTAREALVFVERALKDAVDVEKASLARYSSGTLPPAPWPKHPALVKAIEALEGGRLMLQQAITLGVGDKQQPKTGPTGKRLLTAGENLYRELAAMEKNLEGVQIEDLPKLAARAAARVASTKLGGVATVLAVLWLLHQIGDDE